YAPPAVMGEVIFQYVDDKGNPLYEEDRMPLGEGSYSSDEYRVEAPQGYAYRSVSADQFTIDHTGKVSPNPIVYTYARNPVSGTIRLRYVDQNGKPVADDRNEILGAGPYDSLTFAITVPQGYSYHGVSADTFTITDQGKAEPETITFTYQRAAASVDVFYLNEKNEPVAQP
ncbi:MAG: MucBP domain-containing protein, partial [Clostridia bacterium]